MKAFFDIEYYDDQKNTKDKKIARISAIKVDDSGKRIKFDKWNKCENIPNFYRNMLDIPNEPDISENILVDFFDFIKDCNEIYYYGNEDIIDRHNIKDELKKSNKKFINYEKNILIIFSSDRLKKTNQKLISNSLDINFPFYENHNSIFEVNNFVDIFDKIDSNNYNKDLFIKRYKELLENPNILWNYELFKIEKNSSSEYDKNKKYKSHIINNYLKIDKTLVIDNNKVNYEQDNILEILHDNLTNIIFYSNSNKILESSIKKILFNSREKYTYYKKVS